MMNADLLAVRDLVARGCVSDLDVARAAQHSDMHLQSLAEALLGLGLASARDLAISRARVRECLFVDLAAFEIDEASASLLPAETADRLGALPLFVLDGIATVGMIDPFDQAAVDQIRHVLRCEIDPVLCDQVALRDLIGRRKEAALWCAPSGPGHQSDTGDLARLGMDPADANRLGLAIGGSGLVLVVGPPRSGTSTTARALLGLSTACGEGVDGPAVIEIFDAWGARAAVDAALSGRLVFAPLHAESARGAIARLLLMGVPVAALAESLVAVVMQRRPATDTTTDSGDERRKTAGGGGDEPGAMAGVFEVDTSPGVLLAAVAGGLAPLTPSSGNSAGGRPGHGTDGPIGLPSGAVGRPTGGGQDTAERVSA